MPAGRDLDAALKERRNCSAELANHHACAANELLHACHAAREATFRQFTFLQFGAVTFALNFESPQWQTLMIAVFFGLLGAGTMGTIQYSIERVQEYLRYLEPFQQGEKEGMPQSWLRWRDAHAGSFVGIAPTLRSTPLLISSVLLLIYIFWHQPVSIEGLFLVVTFTGLATIASLLVYCFAKSFKKDRKYWEWHRARRAKGLVTMPPRKRRRKRAAMTIPSKSEQGQVSDRDEREED
jgi:hypothetical protein